MLSGLSTGCRGNAESTTAADREKVCSGIFAWYGGNTGSDTAAAGWRGNAVDVIVWSTGTAGGRVSADIITSRGSIDVTTSFLGGGRVGIDVIQSAVGGENADVPGGAHGGSGRGNVSGAADGRKHCAADASTPENKDGRRNTETLSALYSGCDVATSAP